MNNDEVLRVQTYLRLKFSNDMLTLKRGAKDDMVEVFMEDEFIGTLFRDDEDGEVSYAFNMAILEFDFANHMIRDAAYRACGGSKRCYHVANAGIYGFPIRQVNAFETIICLGRSAKVVTAFASRAWCIGGIANEQGRRKPLGARPKGEMQTAPFSIGRIRLEPEKLKTVIAHVA